MALEEGIRAGRTEAWLQALLARQGVEDDAECALLLGHAILAVRRRLAGEDGFAVPGSEAVAKWPEADAFTRLEILHRLPTEERAGLVSNAPRWIADEPHPMVRAVSARIWRFLYDSSHGLINSSLLATGLIAEPDNWFGSSFSAFWAIMAADVWKTTPFVVLLLLAGLQSIPEELYEQARVDGAGIWTRFRSITLPLLRPVLLVAIIFRAIALRRGQ